MGRAPVAYSPASTGADLGEAPDGASSAAAVAHARLLVQGHSAMRRGKGWQGESVALATDPTNSDTFATGGDDGTVRIWSVAEHRLLAIRTLPLSVSALAYTSDGLHLAVGCVKGGMYILYADTLADALAFSLNALFRVGGPPLQYGTRPIAPSGSGSFAAAAAEPILTLKLSPSLAPI